MFEVEIVITPLFEARVDLAAKGFAGIGSHLVPAHTILAVAVVGSEVVATAKPPDRLLAVLLGDEHAHIGVGSGHIGVARMNHQGYPHGLETAAGQFRARRAGGGGQVGAPHMGEIDPGALKHRALGQHPAATAAAFRPLPLVGDEVGAAVFLRQGSTDAVLKLEQVGFDLFNLHCCGYPR